MKMSKKFLAGALIFSACSALSTVAQADNTITFNGIVSDTTCTATIDGGVTAIDMGTTSVADLKAYTFGAAKNFSFREGANKQVISSQADSLIKISRIWADFFPANTSNQPI